MNRPRQKYAGEISLAPLTDRIEAFFDKIEAGKIDSYDEGEWADIFWVAISTLYADFDWPEYFSHHAP